MPAVSRVIVVSSEARVVDALRFGYERAGASVTTVAMADALSARLSEDAGARPGTARAPWPELVVAGADTVEHAGALLGALRQALNGKEREVPILCLGPRDLSRTAALQAGASELLLAPAFVRDTVTLGQLLVTAARANRRHVIEGHLSDYGGVFFLARAMAAVGRTAVLSLVRGLRRGELRFYRGQITSAQVGMLHGMAALHQLLLWTRAHFELRDEDVVPRRQIPLSTEEILADAQRFLLEMRSVMGTLVPAEVYELVPEQIESGGTASIPAAVYRLVQLIDGYRTLADVIEESPYRVFETLRLANRLAELGWIRPARTSHTGKTPLAGSLRRTGNMSVEHMLANEMSEVSGARIGVVELQSIPGSSKSTAPDARSAASASASGASGGVAGAAGDAGRDATAGSREPASGTAGEREGARDGNGTSQSAGGGSDAGAGGDAAARVVPAAADAAPEQTAEKAPERTAEKAPEQTAEQAPERTAEKAPEQTAEKAPEKAPEKVIDWSDVIPTEMSIGFSPVVPSTEVAGEILSRDQAPVDARVTKGAEARLRSRVPAASERDAGARPARISTERSQPGAAPPPDGDGAIDLAEPPPAQPRPRKNVAASLWKRLFGRGSPSGDDDDGTPRPGGKRGRKRRSRRRR